VSSWLQALSENWGFEKVWRAMELMGLSWGVGAELALAADSTEPMAWGKPQKHGGSVHCRQSCFFWKTLKPETQTAGSYYSFCNILGRYLQSFYLNLGINMLIQILLLNSHLLNYILLSYLSIDTVLFCISYPNWLYCMRSCSRH